MVDFVKKIVSGKKKRYVEEGFNLDLTYITDRVIAMSFPGAGFETVFRNNINDVVKLLEAHHATKYKIFNLSGRKYNYEKFRNQVIDFAWEDHHSPPLDLLFRACQTIHEFLQEDPKNVIVVHCLAGKGRTGSIIACYLLYSGRFTTSQDALQYYKRKRFSTGGGVTQPSQVRYVHYFGEILEAYLYRQITLTPVVVELNKLIIYGLPKISLDYFRPYVEIHAVGTKTLTLTTKRSDALPTKYELKEETRQTPIEIPFYCGNPTIMAGDILIKVYHMRTLKSDLAFRFGFNTAFIQKDAENKAVLELSIKELDPDNVKNDDRFPPGFRVELYMNVLSAPADVNDPYHSYIQHQYKKEQANLNAVYEVVKGYKQPTKQEGSELLFKNSESDDADRVLNKKEKMAFQQKRELSVRLQSGNGSHQETQGIIEVAIPPPEKESPTEKQGIIEVAIPPKKGRENLNTSDEVYDSYSNDDDKSDGSQNYGK